ncbi:MAG: hypothetical protein WEB88_02410 [Gemmatimonadota bacterium]
MRRKWNAAFVLLVPFMFAACAAGTGSTSTDSEAAAVDADRVLLRVMNNAAGVDATVFIEPSAAGVRRQVGSVPANQTRDLIYDFPTRGEYRMDVVYDNGQTRRSPSFRIAGGEIIEWNLSTNRVTTRRR